MNHLRIHDKVFTPYISKETIAQRIAELGADITRDYHNKTPIFIIVLKGAMVFATDLIRAVECPCTIETITARSYGNAMVSSGNVTLINSLPDVQGKDVVLVEDIIDTGLTLHTIREAMRNYNPSSIEIACLLSKPEMHKVHLPIAYCGFEIPPEFVVGYGLDYAEYGRNLPEIYRVAEDNSSSGATDVE